MARPSIDKGQCIGCGTCEQLCPGVFALGSDKVAYVIGTGKVQSGLPCVAQAAEACPEGALVKTDG